MTDKLSLYNGALVDCCGERMLASLAENSETRRLLDFAWDRGAVRGALGDGPWKFATRTVELVASTDAAPVFGYGKAFELPTDFVRTVALCADPYLNSPVTAYSLERGFIFSDVEPLYLSYVSDDAEWGNDMSLWPEDFVEYVEACLAARIIKKLTQDSKSREEVYGMKRLRLNAARNGDAMEGPTKFMPVGRFVRARMGGSGGMDRGSRRKLVG